jgi:uncharacterized SAM-binding protein YcdF (DUF218 family)
MIFTLSGVIMIVLGCHLNDIQNNRIQVAIDYSKNIEYQTWFLTGGVKNAISNSGLITEAEQMKSSLLSKSNVVIDADATNTAENFLNFKKWYQLAGFDEPPQIVITTSAFHKARAEKIFQGIFYDMPINPVWNLSELACPTCWSDENFHMRNVDSDVKKALEKM